MDTFQEINKQYLRTDLPELQVGDEVEVTTKNFYLEEKDQKSKKKEKDEKKKYRLTRFKGTVIKQKNEQRISYTFSVLKESRKVAVRGVFLYHSPLLVSIKKLGRLNQKVHRTNLTYLERELAKKKANE